MWKIRSLTETDVSKGRHKVRIGRSPEPLYWSNEFGWTWKEMGDFYTTEEKDTVNLPMGGVWEEQQE